MAFTRSQFLASAREIQVSAAGHNFSLVKTLFNSGNVGWKGETQFPL
jgi:hypothetical protein